MRSNAWPEAAAGALAACSLEAAWVTLVYVTVEAISRAAPAPLPLVAFACAALAGLVSARWLVRHPGGAGRTMLAAAAVAVAVIGVLLPLAPAAAAVDSPLTVLAMHPGGILLGVALFRGTAHLTSGDDGRIADVALGPGLIGIALVWGILTVNGATKDPAILGVAFAATVTYVTAGLLSIGLARSVELRPPGGAGSDGRTWLWLLIAVVAGMLVVAIPLAAVIGVPVNDAIRGTMGPVGDVLVPLLTVLLWPAGLLVSAIVLIFSSLRGGAGVVIGGPLGIEGPGGFDWQRALGPSGAQAFVLGLVPIVIGIVVAFLLARRLLRRPDLAEIDREVVEIRENEPPSARLRSLRPHVRLPQRPRAPRTASEAYLASLDVLATRPDAARSRSETPAEHARRLRPGEVGLPIGRLAADYALEAFADRRLTPAEHRRAIERWRRIRSTGGR